MSSRGGARPGAGRKLGSTNKLSAQNILEALESRLGKPYAEQLAENYYDTIINRDEPLRHQYDRLFVGKIVADKVDVDINEGLDALAQKQAIFAAAIAQIATKTQED